MAIKKAEVGDRVQLTSVSFPDTCYLSKGDKGTVLRIDCDGDPWAKFDNNSSDELCIQAGISRYKVITE